VQGRRSAVGAEHGGARSMTGPTRVAPTRLRRDRRFISHGADGADRTTAKPRLPHRWDWASQRPSEGAQTRRIPSVEFTP
jgi:hypothetical protein